MYSMLMLIEDEEKMERWMEGGGEWMDKYKLKLFKAMTYKGS